MDHELVARVLYNLKRTMCYRAWELLLGRSNMFISFIIIVIATLAIGVFSEQLSHGTDAVGKKLRLPGDVRGATLDAIASSFPEFCAVVIALIAGVFDAGVGTIVGSALFNVLVIPAASALAAGPLVVQRQVIRRDATMYAIVVVAMIAAIFTGEHASNGHEYRIIPAWVGLVAIITYCGYVAYLVLQAKNSPEENGDQTKLSTWKATSQIVLGMAGIGIACHFLVENTLHVFTEYGLSPAIAGVTVIAAATSLPDTLISVFSARRGDADGAISNAFASNSFDILICLGLPIFVSGGLAVNWDEGQAMLACLLVSTLVAITFMVTKWTLTRLEVVFMLIGYTMFCVAVFYGLL